MARLVQTFDPTVRTIDTGHYFERAGYSVRRETGSSSWLLIFTASGSGQFGFRGGSRVVSEGDVCLLQPRIYHTYGIAEKADLWELQWVHFQARPHWHTILEWPSVGAGLGVVRPSDAESLVIRRRLEEANQLARRRDPADEMLAMVALEEVLIRCHRSGVKRIAERDPRIERAAELALSHLAEPIGVDWMAAAAGLSASRFSHLFRAQVGVSPRLFLERQRLAQARQLLDMSSLSVQEIAAQVGFENAFYLSSRFRRMFGLCPTAYRKKG